MSGSLISVQGLGLERGGRTLLDGLDLELGAGEMLLIEGDNGSGKTTLLRSLAGLSRWGMRGEIRRAPVPLLYLGHRPGIKPLLTPRENLSWYCSAHSSTQNPAADIDAALAKAGLRDSEDTLCQNLSAGQQRRVGLARLYLDDAPLWLLDEPFTAIDRDGIRQLCDWLEHKVGTGTCVLISSHRDIDLNIPLRRVQL